MSKFISDKDYSSVGEIRTLHPGWIVVRVCGGWMAFSSSEDFEEWRKQK